jgi:hypothetical protein
VARRKNRSGAGGSTRATGEFLVSASTPTAIKLKSAEIEPNPTYRYTTPSFSGKRSPLERKKHGCLQEPKDRWCFKPEGKTDKGKAKTPKCFHSEGEAVEAAGGKQVSYSPELKFTGKRCRSGSTACAKSDQTYDAFCAGSNSDPCGSPRATCPVQLVWVEGKPNLRFCKVQGEPGYMVPVKDVSEAMRVSDEACENWPYKLGIVERADGSESEGGWDPEFFDRNAPQIRSQAQRSYPEKEGLGAAWDWSKPAPAAARPQRRTSPWLMFGLIGGIVGATLLKRMKTAPATT